MRNNRIQSIARGVSYIVLSALLFGSGSALAKDGFKSFKLKSPDGSSKTLQHFLNKATLVTFFFPTCSSCNAEFPHLQKIHDKYRGQGLSAVAINLVPEQNSMVAEWQAAHQYTFPVLLGANQDALQNDYDIDMTPTHFLLDAKGKVLLKQIGYKPGDEIVLEERIQKALSPAR